MFKDFKSIFIVAILYLFFSILFVFFTNNTFTCEYLFLIIFTNIVIFYLIIGIIKKFYKLSLKDKKLNELAMREVNHRIKNNIGILTNIIDLKKFIYTDENSFELLDDLRNKTLLISKIHEKIYESYNVQFVNMKQYIEDVINMTNNFYDNAIHIEYYISDSNIKSKQAVDLALIIQEFFTNAVKYAYKNVSDKKFYLEIKKEVYYNILISDNGKGWDQFAMSDAANFGLKMVEAVVKQYNGNIRYENNNGAVAKIKLDFDDK